MKKTSVLLAVVLIFVSFSAISVFASTDTSTEIIVVVEETTSALNPTTASENSTIETVHSTNVEEANSTVIATGQRMIEQGAVLLLVTFIVVAIALWKTKISKSQNQNNRQDKE